MASASLVLVNDGIHPVPQLGDWVADVALFGWECLQGLHASRSRGTVCHDVLNSLAAGGDCEWVDTCYSPQLFSWLTDAEKATALGDAEWVALRDELVADQDPVFLTADSKLPVWRRPVPRFINRLRAMGQGSRSVSSKDSVFLPPDHPLFAPSVAGMREAVALIRNYAPGYYVDLVTVVRGIVLVDHRASFRGASGLNQCGLIFYSPDQEWTPQKWTEELVHESTHYIVHAFDLREHLVTGENALIEAHPGPFRPDLRHHHGNFHALCVVSRLVVLFDRLADAGITPDELRAMRSDYVARCRPAYEALIESATLSPMGLAVFEQWISPMFTK